MCKVCNGVLVFLGRLGNLDWFRCRDCGMEQSVEVEDVSFNFDGDDYVDEGKGV